MPAAWVGAAVALYGAVSKDDGGGGGGGGYSAGTQQNMQAADPFASQRFQYQQALAKLMGMPSGQSSSYAGPVAYGSGVGGGGSPTGGGVTGIGSGSGYIYQPGLGGSTPQANTGYVPSDPSYNFRLQSGSEAIQRAMGAKGLNKSGGMMAALMQYGQNLASTEYQNDFNRLAILSGAESGSPAAAGQLGLQGQQMQSNTDAATLAQWNQWLQPAAKAVGGWLNNGSSSGGSGGGGDGGGYTDSGGSSYSDPFASSSYTT